MLLSLVYLLSSTNPIYKQLKTINYYGKENQF